MIDGAGFSEHSVFYMPFKHLRRSVAVLFGGMVIFCLARGAEPPHIDLIQPSSKYGVVIHFATDAFRTYELQYTFKLVGTNITGINSNNPAAGGWTNVIRVPPSPDPNHQVIEHTMTNAPRYYRLRVTP
jgi:hypothetical protein